MVKIFGLDDITYVSDPYYFITQLPYEKMPEIYNIFDVNMMCTSREGFGMPILESQACGVPSIVTDFAAGPELTHPDLRVKVAAKIFTPILSWTAVPDAEDAAMKLEMLWKDKEKREFYSKWSLENAKQYDWEGPLVKGRWIKAMDLIQDEFNKEKNQSKEEVKQ
jgi:glycosyltransferase involved in cell wall biosynthesis